MKRLLALSLIGTSFFIGLNRLSAEEYDAFGIDYSGDESIGNRIYGVDTSDGSKTLLTSKVFDNNSWSAGTSYVSATTGEIMIRGGGSRYHAYNWKTDTWRDVTDNAGLQAMFEKPASFGIDSSTVQIGSDANDVDVVEDGLNIDGAAVITKNTDGSVQIGLDTNDIDVTAEGINIDGSTLITKSSNTISIGESLRILEDSRKLLMNGNTIIKRNDDGTIQIGTDDDDIDITSQGISVGGRPLITRRANGKIHIGKNSLITTEEEETLSDGRKVQPLYAEDGDGNRIPINIDGSKLLIDGVEVTAGGNNAQINTNKANIKNLGEGVAGSTALTAALSALPQTSKESKLSCGVGSGAYSSRYAVGFGCASKVNERVDINAGGSYVFGGSKSYGEGTLDSGLIKAGFVFKLGELKKPTLISLNEKKELKKAILYLKENNNQIISQNKNLQLENQSIISQNKALLSRLERLEKIALSENKSKDLAVFHLK